VRIVSTAAEIDALPRPLVLVPTMGALHDGHAALVRQGVSLSSSRKWRGGCAVTVFVNPTQFDDTADYARYPRDLAADADLCARAGASVVIAPAADVVYPDGTLVGVPDLPRVALRPGLEDAARAGHFAGVCQVVQRLFQLTRPAAAIFGEKDWQQLQVVVAMTRVHNPAIEIVQAGTVREPDGLAMSSRNRFLSAADRKRATALFRALRAAAREKSPDDAERAMGQVLTAESIDPGYAVVRDAVSLEREPGGEAAPSGQWRALIAARVGTVRLIDNAPWPG